MTMGDFIGRTTWSRQTARKAGGSFRGVDLIPVSTPPLTPPLRGRGTRSSFKLLIFSTLMIHCFNAYGTDNP